MKFRARNAVNIIKDIFGKEDVDAVVHSENISGWDNRRINDILGVEYFAFVKDVAVDKWYETARDTSAKGYCAVSVSGTNSLPSTDINQIETTITLDYLIPESKIELLEMLLQSAGEYTNGKWLAYTIDKTGCRVAFAFNDVAAFRPTGNAASDRLMRVTTSVHLTITDADFKIGVELQKRTPYHNRKIDMNEESQTVLKLDDDCNIADWKHNEVNGSLSLFLKGSAVLDYNYIEITEGATDETEEESESESGETENTAENTTANGENATISGKVVSHWFVLDKQYAGKDIVTLTLKRDVIRDNWDKLQDATFFVERGYVNENDPAIFNPEITVGNKLLQERYSLTSPKYIALFYNLSDNEINVNTTILASDVTYPTVDVKSIKESKLRIYSRTEPNFLVKKYDYGFLGMQWDHALCTARGVDYNDYDGELWTAFTNKKNHSNPDQLAREYYKWLAEHPNTKNVSLEKMGGEVLINNDRNLYNGKTFFVQDLDGKKYKAVIGQDKEQYREDFFVHVGGSTGWATYNSWFADADNQFSSNIEWQPTKNNAGQESNYISYHVYTYWKEWDVEFTEVTVTSQGEYFNIKLEGAALNTQLTNNAFGYNILIGKLNNGSKYPTATKEALIALANKNNTSVADIQIIPFDFDLTNNIVDLPDQAKLKIKTISTESEQQIDEVFVLKDANIQTFVEYEQSQKLFLHNKKTSSIFDTMKIVCPNNSGEVEFCPKHITTNRTVKFAIKGTLSPLPYYSVTPISDGTGLYHYGEVKDLRLVLGGNFSVTQSTDSWANYVANNKYYNEIWAKQQTSNDLNFRQQQENQRFNYNMGLANSLFNAFSNIGINAATGNIGGVASGVVSSGIGIFNQVISNNHASMNAEKLYNINNQTQAELRDLQLATIRSQPNTIRKVGGGNIDNYFSVMLEVYSDYDGQINQLIKNFEYIGYNISRVMKLDANVLQFPITAKLQESTINSESMVVAINDELQQSIKIIPIEEQSITDDTTYTDNMGGSTNDASDTGGSTDNTGNTDVPIDETDITGTPVSPPPLSV